MLSENNIFSLLGLLVSCEDVPDASIQSPLESCSFCEQQQSVSAEVSLPPRDAVYHAHDGVKFSLDLLNETERTIDSGWYK